jgi:hypothetical protein
LLSSKGNRTDQRDIDLLSDQIVTIAVVAIPVHGWLTVGGEPLAAAFSLVSDDGVRIDFKSNDRGMFSGVLTREGVWRPIVRLSGAALNLKPLAVRKAPSGGAEIKIELPGGEIVGRVVDSEGDPASASVLVFHDEQLEISAQTDENGAFRLRGLETGSRLIQAIAPAGESGRIAVDVGNHDAATVTLTIAAARRLRERLLDAAGDAVPGATIYFQNPRSEQRRTESGLTGDFTLVVPADAGVVWAAVVAPGLPIKFFSIAASDAGDGQQFVMGSASGRLEIQLHGSVPPWPTVSRRGDAPFALFQLFVPHAGGPPREYRPPATYSLDVEPGIYDICLSTASVCRVATVAAGSQATVQLATEK